MKPIYWINGAIKYNQSFSLLYQVKQGTFYTLQSPSTASHARVYESIQSFRML
jgi:hypothetical protein